MNPITNKIYVSALGGSNSVAVIDCATNTVTAVVPVGQNPFPVVVNPVSNKIYLPNLDSATGASNLTVIDGATDTATTVAGPAVSQPVDVGLNAVTNTIYVTNFGTSGIRRNDNVAEFKEQQIQPTPIQATITPLAENQTSGPTPNFSFTATTSFTPNAPEVENLYFQIDTWQGPWIAATARGANFTGAPVSPLPSTPPPHGTPAGTSTLTITATSNGVSHSTQLTLTVQ